MLETIKHWLSKPAEPVTRQLVFMPELNRTGKRRLEALNQPILCISPQKPKPTLLGQMLWQPLPESTIPPQSLYAIARQLVDIQTAAIKAYLPDFFKNTELQVDYEPTYRINRHQRLAIIGLPFLARCFESYSPPQESSTLSLDKPVILDSPIAPALLAEDTLHQFNFPEFTALFPTPEPLTPPDFKKRRSPIKVPAFSKPTVLLVMSAPVHYDLALPALEHLEKDYTIVIYLANPDKLEPAQRQKLSQQYFTIDAHTLQPDERLIRNACGYFNRRVQQIENLPVPATLREALFGELNRLSDTIHIMCLLETLLTHIRPTAVLGCLERNRLSVALHTLQNRYCYKILNFQHGTMPLLHNMDWQQFDRFFVWNPLSRNVILKDGYQHPESVAIVGNPFWEQSNEGKRAPTSAKAQEIISWRGDSPLIGAYTQYSGDYLTNEVRRNYLKILFTYLEQRPYVKLLIKKHPLETDRMAEEMLAQTKLQEQVRICVGRDLDLWESFSLIRFSTTVCSTTLLDSLKVQVPTVGLDFTRIIADIGYGFDEEPGITIIHDPQAVTAIFDELLAKSTHYSGALSPENAEGSLVYPQLPGNYSQRIKQHLIELGLLQVPAEASC